MGEVLYSIVKCMVSFCYESVYILNTSCVSFSLSLSLSAPYFFAVTRFEFVEIICRLGITKYIDEQSKRKRERERERERGRQTRPNRSYVSAFPASSLVSSRLFSHVSSSLTSFSHLISSPISFRLSCPLLCPPVPPFDRFFSKVL